MQVAALQALWISHKHADHMLGVQGMLEARPPNAPLLVSLPLSCSSMLCTSLACKHSAPVCQSAASSEPVAGEESTQPTGVLAHPLAADATIALSLCQAS